MGSDVLAVLFVSPSYSAVIVWLPKLSAAVEKDALAVVLETVRVPKVVVPSLKVTVPEGEEPFAMVAVKVTLVAKLALKLELVTVVVVDFFKTVCLITEEVTELFSLSPS